MIVITGATGQLGSQVVQRLLERMPPSELAVSVREPDRAAGLAAGGVRVRRGDYTDPDSLADAFAGATSVFVVSGNSTGANAIRQHEAAIDAARDAGARRIVYTSHMGSSADSLFAPMPDHAATERYLAGSGVAYTALRHGFYASTVPHLLGAALRTGELAAPADGPVSWTTHADLAAAAAIVLADEGSFPGATPPFTALQAHDLASVAAILSELTGRTIRRVVVEDQDWVRSMTARGVPDEQVQTMLGLFLASRRGEFAATDPTLGRLLGRDPQSVRTVLVPAVAAADRDRAA